MVSPGIREFAIEKGWWDPASGKALNWRWDFATGCVWITATAVSPGSSTAWRKRQHYRGQPALLHQAPKKLTLAEIFDLHRDHYEGSEFDQTTSLTAVLREPAPLLSWNFNVDGSAYSWNRTISAIGCDTSS